MSASTTVCRPACRPNRRWERVVYVVYRTGAGRVREAFSRARIGAALMRAEFLERVEDCPVYIQHGRHGKLIRAVS